MSADNWTICPKCKDINAGNHKKAVEGLKKAYGKIPAEKYAEMLKKVEAGPTPLEDTLREDYEIGVTEDGKFYVHYKGSCDRCGFSHKFDKVETVHP